jgi:hypothetical protein
MSLSIASADYLRVTRRRTIRTALKGFLLFHAPYSFAARVTLEAMPWLEIVWARIWHFVVVVAREGGGTKTNDQVLFTFSSMRPLDTPSYRGLAEARWLTDAVAVGGPSSTSIPQAVTCRASRQAVLEQPLL